MAGGGSVLNMIKTLKANRSMLKKRKPMTSGKSGNEKTLVDHKSFSKEAKKEYYAKLVEEKVQNKKKMVVAGMLTLVGLVIFIASLIYWMRQVFDF